MAFCSNCGTQVQDDVKFCSSCGEKIGATGAPRTADSGQSEKLSNLYQLARRARSENNIPRGAQYYEQILIEDPNSWEATFFSAYFTSANHYVNDELGSAIMTLGNSLNNVFHIIENIDDTDEQMEAVRDVRAAAQDALDTYRAKGERDWEMTKAELDTTMKEIRRGGGSVNYEAVNSTWDSHKARSEAVKTSVDQAESVLTRRVNAILDSIAQRRFDEYWEEHQEEREELESEKETLEDQVADLREEIDQVAQADEDHFYMLELHKKVEFLNARKSSYGSFKKTDEKNAVQAKIDATNAAIAPIQARIDDAVAEIRGRISPLNARIEYIDNELTRPR